MRGILSRLVRVRCVEGDVESNEGVLQMVFLTRIET